MYTCNHALSGKNIFRIPLTTGQKSAKAGAYSPEGVDLLEYLKMDIHQDVSGMMPLSGINYLWVLARFYMFFMLVEQRLKKLRNPSWVAAYESADRDPRGAEKRVALTIIGKDTLSW